MRWGFPSSDDTNRALFSRLRPVCGRLDLTVIEKEDKLREYKLVKKCLRRVSDANEAYDEGFFWFLQPRKVLEALAFSDDHLVSPVSTPGLSSVSSFSGEASETRLQTEVVRDTHVVQDSSVFVDEVRIELEPQTADLVQETKSIYEKKCGKSKWINLPQWSVEERFLFFVCFLVTLFVAFRVLEHTDAVGHAGGIASLIVQLLPRADVIS